MGATRGDLVMVLSSVLITGTLGGLSQQVDKICQFELAVGSGWHLEFQQQAGSVGKISLGRVPQSVVANLVKASWQDVLEKTPQEFDAGQPDGSPGVAASILRAEHHVRVIHRENPCLTDRDLEDIP